MLGILSHWALERDLWHWQSLSRGQRFLSYLRTQMRGIGGKANEVTYRHTRVTTKAGTIGVELNKYTCCKYVPSCKYRDYADVSINFSALDSGKAIERLTLTLLPRVKVNLFDSAEERCRSAM